MTLPPPGQDVSLRNVQDLIRSMFGEKDAARGPEATFLWFTEEVGELAGALRGGPKEELALEFADVLAWLATLANIAGVDLEEAVRAKYGGGCPRCGAAVCVCDPAKKP
uniref:MazG nucleotide pyrophosphohydrolase domain-containing protein n=1 Tax=Alienimonas californiensis TaxID=2527989 RepID=UPI001F60FA9E|nr:MazG nucleotide pyrophosphohydrolase domain-containing protein [Alienimonas californiensis]